MGIRRIRRSINIRNMDRKVVGKRGIVIKFGDFKIGVMKRNRDRRENDRVIKERNGKKKTINTGRPGKWGSRVISMMIEGVVFVEGIK